ncbi:FGGY-family carbohydrate kinase, partial [Sedimentibacter sp. B4]|uniref:FGGY-family carbohydrate kinase n=1 Tax=Sedimentibacter sp. B4 TaxID=304766 RepID=UPI002101C941
DTMARVSGNQILQIAVDGGASRNDLLMQFQADQLGVRVVRPANTEATSVGAALLAGLASGIWATQAEALATQSIASVFEPSIAEPVRAELYRNWTSAVTRAQGWAKK